MGLLVGGGTVLTMGLREWWRQRRAHRGAALFKEALGASLEGFPEWALSARLMSARYAMGLRRLSEYVSAFETGDTARLREAGESVADAMDEAAALAREVPLDGALGCIEAFQAISAAARAGALPPPEAVDVTGAFCSQAFEAVSIGDYESVALGQHDLYCPSCREGFRASDIDGRWCPQCSARLRIAR